MAKIVYVVCVITLFYYQVCLVEHVTGLRGSLSKLLIADHNYNKSEIKHGYNEWPLQSTGPQRVQRSLTEGPEITSLSIESRLYSRFSETWVESTVRNPDSVNKDVLFTVQIPELALISNFSMVINDVVYIADVKEKKQAQKEYEQAKQDNKTAGLVSKEAQEVPGAERGMEVFSVAVTVASNSFVVFTLTYQELLTRSLGRYEKSISVRPNQVVQKLSANLWLYEPQGIDYINVFEPSLETNSLQNVFTTLTHVSDTVKQVVYEPSIEWQSQVSSDHGISGDLLVVYDVIHTFDAGETLYQGSYFVHYFSPDESQLSQLYKSIIFVIDISGSMGGIKIEQTRDAMLTILDQLGAADRFMLLLFSDGVEYWPSNNELVGSNEETIDSAKEFVKDRVVATGGTNINKALVQASQKLVNFGSTDANMIIFLTDGEPTVGETSPMHIVSNVVEIASVAQVAIYSLAFGQNLNYLLLEMLSYSTQGTVKQIYVDTDASEQLQNFFLEVSKPLLLNLRFIFPETLILQEELTRSSFSQYFQGSEVIVAGKLIPDAPNQWEVQAKANSFDMTKTVSSNIIYPDEAKKAVVENFIQKLFAFFKIKDLLYNIKIIDDLEERHSLEMKALNLSLEYGLVTSLTSMVIVQQQDTVDEHWESAAFDPNMKNIAHDEASEAASVFHIQYLNTFIFLQVISVKYCTSSFLF